MMMKLRFLNLILVGSVALASESGFGQSLPQSAIVPNLHVHGQETDDWCWAASAETIMDTLGATTDIRQCKQADVVLEGASGGDCCQSTNVEGCIAPAWPNFKAFGFNASETDTDSGGLSWSVIQTEIAVHKRPFAFTWNWEQGNAHMMVAVGYGVQNGQQSVNIFNPLPRNGGIYSDRGGFMEWITYEQYLAVPGDHTHSKDYFNVFRMPVAVGAPPGAPPSIKIDDGSYALSGTKNATQKLPVYRTVQSPMFRTELQNASSAVASGIQKMVPNQFTAGDSKSTFIGDALPNINVGVDEIFSSTNGPSGAPASDIATSVARKLTEQPLNLVIPIKGTNSERGVLAMSKINNNWRWTSFQVDSPLSAALLPSGSTVGSKTDLASCFTKSNCGAYTAIGVAATAPPKTAGDLKGVVAVRGLNVSFLAIQTGEGLMFNPLVNSPKYGFIAGQLVPASTAFAILQAKGSLSNLPR